MERVPLLLALPPWHQPVLFSREQCIRWPTGAGTRSMDPKPGRADAVLRLLAHSRVIMDVVERGELDHDGRCYGRRQFPGSPPPRRT